MSLSTIRFGAVHCIQQQVLPTGECRYRFELTGSDVDRFQPFSYLDNPAEIHLLQAPVEGLKIEREITQPRPFKPEELPLVKQLLDVTQWMPWRNHNTRDVLLNGLLVAAAQYLPKGPLIDELITRADIRPPYSINEPTGV